ncbi:MAG TPA: metalloregulator ArsR/SmtB family transcription factor [Ktedonobacterales bacterium]|nr:metalloregulator ArsR/SmtB family transcription factor [Ktedonobacterales bacterium]
MTTPGNGDATDGRNGADPGHDADGDASEEDIERASDTNQSSANQGSTRHLEELVRFYKALADPTRLRLVGMLLERPMYGQELAEALEVRPATISHHLAELRAAGLLRERKVDNYRYFEVDTARLRALSGMVFEGASRPTRAPRADERARVVSTYLVNGRLTSIPTQRKRVIYLLEELVRAFDYDRRYSEAEVNAVLGGFHEDVATLRRELIGYRLLARERGVYWRVGDQVGHESQGGT